VARYWPQWRRFSIADMMTSAVKDPMTALSQAIKNADAQTHDTAFKQLTDGCNSCDQATNVGVNIIWCLTPRLSPIKISAQQSRSVSPA
jgi:hypothetical protein